MDLQKKIVVDSAETKRMAIAYVQMLPTERPHDVIVKEHSDTRTLEQNRKMFRVLQDLAEQVDWYGERLTRYDWKDMITAALKGQKVVPGIEGGFVVLGARTSEMNIKQMSDVIEFAQAFGAEKGVKWTEKKRR
jgi:hypothetical protein